MAVFAGITIAMMIAQRTFSRYHYLPWIALLSIGTGLGVDWASSPANFILIGYGLDYLLSLLHGMWSI